MSECLRVEKCYCGRKLERVYTVPGITGTRDGFGVNKEFYSPHAKKYINTWKGWERAKYCDVKNDTTMSHTLKEKVKEKMDKIKFYKSKGEDPGGKTGMGGE